MAFVIFWHAKDAIAALDEVVLVKGGRQLKISIPFDKNTRRNKPTEQYPNNYTKNRNERRYNRNIQHPARPKPSKV